MHKRCAVVLLLLALLLVADPLGVAAWALEGPIDSPPAVQPDPAWRSALRKEAPPWYDSSADDYTSMRPKQPPAPAERPTSDPRQPRDWRSGGRSGTGGGRGEERSITFSAGSGGSTEALSWVLSVLLVMAVLVVVAMAVAMWLQANPRQKRTSTASATHGDAAVVVSEVEVAGMNLRVDELEAAIAAAARAGDWQRVAIIAYARMLGALGQVRLITLRKGTTNRGYLAELSRTLAQVDSQMRSSAHEACQRLVQLFERTWFGKLNVAADEGQQAMADAQQVADRADAWRRAADTAQAVGSGAQQIPAAAQATAHGRGR